MERIPAQPTFTDLTLAGLGSPRAAEFFQRCDKLIPFDKLAFDKLAASVADIFVADSSKGGAPHWSVAMMLKILFVQKCYGLSGPMTQEAQGKRIWSPLHFKRVKVTKLKVKRKVKV